MHQYLSQLRVFQMGRSIVRDVYSLTDSGALGSLRDQLRRAAVSIVSNIAEGADRGSKRDFVRFLVMARGSCGELRAQLAIASDCRLLPDHDLDDRLDHLGRSLTRLIRRLEARGPS